MNDTAGNFTGRTTSKNYGNIPVSNAGTQKYIDMMKYAANVSQGATPVTGQSALDRLKAAQAINDRYKKYNDQLITHGYSHAGDEKYIGKDLGGGDNGGNGGDNDGNGGDNGGGTKNKLGVSVSVGSSSPSLNLSGSSSTTPAQPVPDTTVQDAYQAQLTAANDRLKQAYEFQQAQYQRAKDDAFREAYIKQQMVERAYPEQLAAAGIRGGAGVGVIARNNADYAKQRTSIYNNYLNNLANAGQTYQQGVLGNNEDYLRSMAAYQQALKQMELQHQYDKELAILRASLG